MNIDSTMLGAALAILAFTGCGNQPAEDIFPDDPEAYREGVIAARADITNGTLQFLTGGFARIIPSSVIKQKYKIDFVHSHGCIVGEGDRDRLKGYNHTMAQELQKRHGITYDELMQEMAQQHTNAPAVEHEGRANKELKSDALGRAP